MPLTVGTLLMPIRRGFVLSATCLLLLTGCGKGTEQPSAKAAGAQVLPGTVSDAMLNLDQSRSRPLLQPPPRPGVTASDAPADEPGTADAPPAAADDTAKPPTVN